MTRHSTLNNADDLHYAKIRTFTGNPNAIAPNFIDQILTATDTNKVYRATGIIAGALVELIANDSVGGDSSVIFNNELAIAPQIASQILIDTSTNRIYRATGLDLGNWIELIGGSDGAPSTISISAGSPSVAPIEVGQMYFDYLSRIQWVAVRAGSVNGWVELGHLTSLNCDLLNNSVQSFSSNSLHIFYADVTDVSNIENADYTFTNYLGEVNLSGGGATTNDIVFPQGRGAFVFVPAIQGIDPALIAINTEEMYTGSNSQAQFEIRESAYNLFANDGLDFIDVPIGKKYLWITSYRHDESMSLISKSVFGVRTTVSDA